VRAIGDQIAVQVAPQHMPEGESASGTHLLVTHTLKGNTYAATSRTHIHWTIYH